MLFYLLLFFVFQKKKARGRVARRMCTIAWAKGQMNICHFTFLLLVNLITLREFSST